MDLRDLRASPVDAAQLVLSNLRIKQERLHKKIEKEIVEQACHLDEIRANYHGLTNDL